MAYNNTFYYLNNQDEFDNEVLMSPCSMVADEEQLSCNEMPLTCFVTPLKQPRSSHSRICSGVPEVLCEDSCSISSNASSEKSQVSLSDSLNAFSSVYMNAFSDVSIDVVDDILHRDGMFDCLECMSLESDSGANMLREKLICGVWWKEFGVSEKDVVESVSINENDKVLCRGIIALSENQRNIYIIGDICFEPYLKERLIAIMDLVSNYIYCKKMFIRLRKSYPGVKALVNNLLWIGFKITPSICSSSQSYILLSIAILFKTLLLVLVSISMTYSGNVGIRAKLKENNERLKKL
ncbi:hypothetical protein PORY_000589 [Pneumocystis oryctolagi]|uniref:Uncharacterized protein n=1 Tax=Pneumocystis oryctolagi TaxID=42067 RepID=A0ACB7CD51_9ASCO|nr:hypothetical protein PORY_000589 [Pneumocystis oryctolagi]